MLPGPGHLCELIFCCVVMFYIPPAAEQSLFPMAVSPFVVCEWLLIHWVRAGTKVLSAYTCFLMAFLSWYFLWIYLIRSLVLWATMLAWSEAGTSFNPEFMVWELLHSCFRVQVSQMLLEKPTEAHNFWQSPKWAVRLWNNRTETQFYLVFNLWSHQTVDSSDVHWV